MRRGWVLTALFAVLLLLAGAVTLRAEEVPESGPPHGQAAAEPQPGGHSGQTAEPQPGGHEGQAAGEKHAAGHSAADDAIHAAEHSSFVDLILKGLGYKIPEEGAADRNPRPLSLIAMFQMPIISAVVIFLLAAAAVSGTRKREMVPGRAQNVVEMVVGGLDDFVQGVLGMEGRTFVPFLGTLFLYILVMNLIGIVPFFKAPTSSYNTTVALAICVFLYVQWTGVRKNGIGGYVFHLAGEPRDVVGWILSPLMFPLHVIGELAKPLSLSLRLFGNIFGEETLIAVFVGLGVAILSFTHLPVGIPLQLPFLLLALLTGTIQALVFMLLATIYFSLMLPHHEHHEEPHGSERKHH